MVPITTHKGFRLQRKEAEPENVTSTKMSSVSNQVCLELTVTLEKPMKLGKGTIPRVPSRQAASSSRSSPNIPP